MGGIMCMLRRLKNFVKFVLSGCFGSKYTEKEGMRRPPCDDAFCLFNVMV